MTRSGRLEDGLPACYDVVMKRTRKRPEQRKRAVSISIRSGLLAEVDRRAAGDRSAFIEEAIRAHLRAAKRNAIDTALREYYSARPETERREEERLSRDFASADREAWTRFEEDV